ncbi:hypothetical protein BJX96DRAFT_159591 [Aspergillus floccosus]
MMPLFYGVLPLFILHFQASIHPPEHILLSWRPCGEQWMARRLAVCVVEWLHQHFTANPITMQGEGSGLKPWGFRSSLAPTIIVVSRWCSTFPRLPSSMIFLFLWKNIVPMNA